MSESLAHVHVPELPEPAEALTVANDNQESAPLSQPAAANDNVKEPIALAVPEMSVEASHALSETRARLGLAEDMPVVSEEESVPEEAPQLKPEDLQEMVRQVSLETAAAHSDAEATYESAEANTAQSAGGASDNQGGGGKNPGDTGGSGNAPSSREGGKKGVVSRLFGWLWKAVKYVLWTPFALFALGMDAVIKTTQKALDAAKLSKGGGGGSKSSGGGGGGGHGGGHH